MSRVENDSRYLFGLHDPGGEGVMLSAGREGWVLFTEELGSDPNNRAGTDYTPWSSRGLGIISRLNNGYYPNGTIPHSSRYANFAKRCANFVRSSRGCHIWIIGNEMNYAIERPQGSRGIGFSASSDPAQERGGLWGWIQRLLARIGIGSSPEQSAPTPARPLPPPEPNDSYGRDRPERFSALHPSLESGDGLGSRNPAGEVITPDLYARCYTLCRDAIRAVPGHERDQVLVGAVAPWNNQTKYPANPSGDWIKYFEDILNLLGPDGCDGFSVHTYTHQADPNLITVDFKMNAPFQNRHYEFRTYQDFMNAVPRNMRHLAAYITETDQDVAWENRNIGWVQRAYGEIDWWNKQPGNQQIRSMILYRWPRIDKWYIEGKAGVIQDFRDAMKFDYRWRTPVLPQLSLEIGDFVRPTTTVNVRRSPGYIGQPSNDVVTQAEPDDLLRLVNATYKVVDNLIWWQVEIQDGPFADTQVWVAETAPGSGGLLIQPAQAPTTPPPVTPTPPVTSGFASGDTARTLTIVNLRRSPGYRGKPADDVVAQIPDGGVVEIQDGPQSKDGLTWWRVETTLNNNRLNGWLADAAPSGEPLLEKVSTAPPAPKPPPVPVPPPVEPPAPTPSPEPGVLAPGAEAVTVAVVRFRRNPGYVNQPPNDVIGDLPQGVTVGVLAGPRQVDGLRWWQIRAPFNGSQTDGWVAEIAPNGTTLLAPASQGTPPPPTPAFAPGDIITSSAAVRVRRTTGFISKPENDVLGQFWSRTTLQVEGGPEQMDGLTWWQVTGVTVNGQVVTGWTAQQAPNNVDLISKPAKLGSTDIPNPAAGRYLSAPYRGQFLISQLWGENPTVYSQFQYDGVALLGHNGVDFATPIGTALVATDDGRVSQAGFDPGGFGNYILIQHSWGESLYAHLSRIAVQRTQAVSRGQFIGDSGNTGNSTGPHLHFALRIDPYVRTDGWGGYTDPLPYMNPNSYTFPGYFRKVDPLAAVGAAASLSGGPAMETLGPEDPEVPRP